MAQINIRLLEDAIKPLAHASNMVLEEVKVRSAGRRQLVQVIVDSDNPIDLDMVAGISREIDHVIEDKNLLGENAFTLEVTTPGIDRPLVEPRHWRKNIGRLVEVTTLAGEKFTARITGFDDGFVALEGHDQLSIDAVETAVVQIEFNRGKSEEVALDDEGDDE
jgi:ribosome maturation factor RimP